MPTAKLLWTKVARVVFRLGEVAFAHSASRIVSSSLLISISKRPNVFWPLPFTSPQNALPPLKMLFITEEIARFRSQVTGANHIKKAGTTSIWRFSIRRSRFSAAYCHIESSMRRRSVAASVVPKFLSLGTDGLDFVPLMFPYSSHGRHRGFFSISGKVRPHVRTIVCARTIGRAAACGGSSGRSDHRRSWRRRSSRGHRTRRTRRCA
jgi:hypothetical protein